MAVNAYVAGGKPELRDRTDAFLRKSVVTRKIESSGSSGGKSGGELEDEKNMTIRSSIVGPDINKDGVGLLNWFMQQSQIVDGYTNVFWSGQTTLQYAKTIEAIVPEKVYGIFNMVPDESISKNDLLVLFNKYLRKDKVVIRPKNDIVCDKSLKRTRKDFDFPIPDYEKMIVELLEWMRVHRRLYPHYHLD